MKSLWFKQCYVSPILSGAKIDTIRKLSNRLPKINSTVNLTVGPRPPFAKAKILSVTKIDIDKLSAERLSQVLVCYPDTSKVMAKITFQVILLK